MTAISPILGWRLTTQYQPTGTLSDTFQISNGGGSKTGLTREPQAQTRQEQDCGTVMRTHVRSLMSSCGGCSATIP